MQCPSCNQTNKLTWRKYIESPLGRHICEHCQSQFCFQHTIKYYAAIIALWILSGLLPGIVCLMLGASLVQALFVFWILGFSVVLPADKKIDDTWRGTVLRKVSH